MKAFIIVLVVFITGISALQAQDLIVTTQGDSIKCKITLKTFNFMRFRSEVEGEVHHISMPISEIDTYQYNFYRGSEIPKVKKIRNHDYQHWRMGITGGWSKHTAPTSPYLSSSEIERAEKLKSGKIFGAGVQYYIHQQTAVGLKYVNFSSSSGDRTQFFISKGDLSINYFGANYGKRWLNVGRKNTLLFNVGPGYVNYRYGKDQAFIKARNIGWMADLGYDIYLSDLASLAFEASYLHARLKKYDEYREGHYQDTEELRQGYYEGLYRFDISVGIRFNL